MLSFFKKILDLNQREITKLSALVVEINKREGKYKNLKEGDFLAKTKHFKKLLSGGKTMDEILPDAFAVVREAADKAIGLRPYGVQLVAAIAFHQGKIAEQKTGEGKTLSAVPALYLNALSGKGAHLVTVNDYLARIGAGWNGPIFHLL